MGTAIYQTGFVIVYFIAFVALWIYAAVTYGPFLGIGLGWIPAGVIAALIGAAWPLLAFLGILAGLALLLL